MLYALAFIAALVVVVLIAASRQPDMFRVERSTTIAAPPTIIAAQIDDFHNFQKWSPFVAYDPNMQTTYSGPPSGVGASMAWSGNSKAGQGTMTVLEERPDLIRFKLEFTKPFAATNSAEFTFQPEANGTRVTWAMIGHNTFMFKIMHIVMSMDKMVGGDFDRGLANLKTLVEAK